MMAGIAASLSFRTATKWSVRNLPDISRNAANTRRHPVIPVFKSNRGALKRAPRRCFYNTAIWQ